MLADFAKMSNEKLTHQFDQTSTLTSTSSCGWHGASSVSYVNNERKSR
jgi:hypothetical protein